MEHDLDVKKIEDAINDIMPGLTMYVRDVNLTDEIASKYQPGMIIMEKGFTDASNRVMGMVTSHRYAILSNHMGDFREYEHGTNWGLFVAKNNSHFKVIDIYEYNGKTQILLLHLPDDKRWKLFDNVYMNIESDLIERCRERFTEKAFSEVIPELATDVWIDRCRFPVGMTDEGIFFDVEIKISELAKTISDVNFRNLYHEVVYIQCAEVLERLKGKGIETDNGQDGVIAYGYIDEHSGFSFHILATAKTGNDIDLDIYEKDSDVMLVLRRGFVSECMAVPLVELGEDISRFAEIIEMLRSNYDTKNVEKEEMRKMEFLDEFRDADYPDDVAVVIFHEELQPERVWVRCVDVTEEMLYGTLLNEPNQNYGVHLGQKIGFVPIKGEHGMLLMAHIE